MTGDDGNYEGLRAWMPEKEDGPFFGVDRPDDGRTLEEQLAAWGAAHPHVRRSFRCLVRDMWTGLRRGWDGDLG